MNHSPSIPGSRFPRFFVLILISALLPGCSEPLWFFPGGTLDGEESPLLLKDLPAAGGVMALETNPVDPYSVTIGYSVIDGNMYIDPADGRRWYQNMVANPQVRIRLEGGTSVHPAVAVAETDLGVLERFEADRKVLRLMPR